MPGYVLVNMEITEDAWELVKGTPGVTGFVGSRNEPVPLAQPEVDRLLHRETAAERRGRAQFWSASPSRWSPGRCPTSRARSRRSTRTRAKLKVLVSIFGRETPVEVGFDQVKKI